MSPSHSTFEDDRDASGEDALGEDALGEEKTSPEKDAPTEAEASATPWWTRRWVRAVAVVLVFMAAATLGIVEELLKAALPVGVIVYLVRRRLRAVEEEDAASTFARIRAQDTRSAQVREGAKEMSSRIAQRVLKFGGGFYGVVATVAFFVFQVQALWEDSQRTASAVSQTAQTMEVGALGTELWRVALEMLMRVGTDTISSLIQASVWPLFLVKSVGLWAAIPIFYVGYKGFQWLRRRYPTLDELLAGRERSRSPISTVSFDDASLQEESDAPSDGVVRITASQDASTSKPKQGKSGEKA